MSRIKKIIFGLTAVGFMAFNFVAGYSPNFEESSDSFTLKNLNALQASAGEIYCENLSEYNCSFTWHIEGGGSVTISGKGPLRHILN